MTDTEVIVQCGRCGSSVEWVDCEECGGQGTTLPGELYESDPLWYGRDDVDPCHICEGERGWWRCLSSPAWCQAHPRPGCAAVERSTPDQRVVTVS